MNAKASADVLPAIIANCARSYWRNIVVGETARAFGITVLQLEPYIAANPITLGQAMRDLLNELHEQDQTSGRTSGMQEGCIRRCGEIARQYDSLITHRPGAA